VDLIDDRLKPGNRAFRAPTRQHEVDEPFPKCPAFDSAWKPLRQMRPKSLGGPCPRADLAREDRLDASPQGLAKDWRGAVSRDADDHRRPIDDRPELEIAGFGSIDDIDQRSRGPGLPTKLLDLGLVSRRLEQSDRDIREIGSAPRATMKRDPAAGLRRQGQHAVTRRRSENGNLGSSRSQQSHLPESTIAAADDDGAL
jgi:hypothetical protein